MKIQLIFGDYLIFEIKLKQIIFWVDAGIKILLLI